MNEVDIRLLREQAHADPNETVSIIMGAYNCEETVADAIESILSQTYTDWELVICDDCSTDGTYQILENYQKKYPSKIVCCRNEKNSYLAFSLNRCLEYTTGKYIARMDADDLSAPNRLERQVNYLRKFHDVDLVGTNVQRFDENGYQNINTIREFPDRLSLRKNIPFQHATILTYKYVYDILDGYTVSEITRRSQDRELWFRFFAAGFSGVNMQEPLYIGRVDTASVKRRTAKVRMNSLRITINGFKLMGFPKRWIIVPILKTLFRIALPFFVQNLFRKAQGRYGKHI